MPIRFRCVYCNQLLGISRRKAGTIVRCTSCEGQLIVPDPSDAATEAGSQEHASDPPPAQSLQTDNSGGPAGAFEGAEFDAFLEPMNAGGGQAVASPPAPAVKRSPAVPARSTIQPNAVPVITLTRRGLTVAIVLAAVVLAAFFAGGLWLGLSLR
jgi:hypothetical protein